MRSDPNVVLFVCWLITAVIAVAACIGVVHLGRKSGRLLRRAQLAERQALRWQDIANNRRHPHPVAGGETVRLPRVPGSDVPDLPAWARRARGGER